MTVRIVPGLGLLLILGLLGACATSAAEPIPVTVLPTQQGSVLVDITVGTDGLPRACDIARSSGDPEDDARACRFWMRVGRWEIQTDEGGRPVEYHRKIGVAPSALQQLRDAGI